MHSEPNLWESERLFSNMPRREFVSLCCHLVVSFGCRTLRAHWQQLQVKSARWLSHAHHNPTNYVAVAHSKRYSIQSRRFALLIWRPNDIIHSWTITSIILLQREIGQYADLELGFKFLNLPDWTSQWKSKLHNKLLLIYLTKKLFHSWCAYHLNTTINAS